MKLLYKWFQFTFGILTVYILGTWIGRVKIIFRLPLRLQLIGSIKTDAPLLWPRIPLAYIEWYSTPTLSQSDSASHNMSTVKKSPLQSDGSCPWSIIPLTNIRQSCMLIPNLKKVPTSMQPFLTSSNILDTANTFLVNNWSSVYTYKTIYKE